MPKFIFKELVRPNEVITARLSGATGDGTRTAAAGNAFTDTEVGKCAKLIGDSRYGLCAAGDPIEGFISSVEAATLDDYTFGAVQLDGRKEVTFDGLQATAGTGTIALGDYVVCGTVTAKDTALSAPAKVCKATDQPFATPGALSNVPGQIKCAVWAWRVVSLGSAGTGAVGTTGIIERVGA